jgi:hypothetical protein
MAKQKYNPIYYKNNRQRIIDNQKRFNSKHKKEILEYMKKRFQLLKGNSEFKNKRKAWHLAWRMKNIEKIREKSRAYYLKRKGDPSFNRYKQSPRYLKQELERGK